MTDRSMEALLREWACDEDRVIQAADRRGAAFDTAALDEALRALAAGEAAPAFRCGAPDYLPEGPAACSPAGVSPRDGRAAGTAPLTAGKLLLISLAAALAICGGAVAASPGLRGAAAEWFGTIGLFAEQRTGSETDKAPGDYVIPSPGEGFRVTDETRSERLAAVWYTAERRQVMVQIAYALSEDAALSDAEELELGGLTGWCREREGTVRLTLRDGKVWISVQYFNADRETAEAYAEAIVASNK